MQSMILPYTLDNFPSPLSWHNVDKDEIVMLGLTQALALLGYSHRRRYGAIPPTFLAYLVILCFERR